MAWHDVWFGIQVALLVFAFVGVVAAYAAGVVKCFEKGWCVMGGVLLVAGVICAFSFIVLDAAYTKARARAHRKDREEVGLRTGKQ